MRSMRVGQVVRMTVLCAAVFVMLSDAGVRGGSEVMAAQRSPAMNSGRPIDPPTTGLPPVYSPDLGNSTESAADAQLRARAASEDRHKKVAADVDKLVALSNELKSDVDKTTKDELSLDVIRKAQAIEKLAQDVQSRMKN